MSDNRFEPINRAHAIVEMIFFFEFVSGLDENIDRLLSLRSDLKDDFPSSYLLETVEVEITPQTPQTPRKMSSKTGGIELQRFKTDDSLEWLIRVTPTSISIHCLDYTRWKNVLEKVNVYVKKIFEKLLGTDVNISGMGLKYVDQFVFCGELKDYDASLLFKRDSSLLHLRAFSSGHQWHCHSGWFEDVREFGEILSQMNIDSIVSSIDGVQRAVVVIDHAFIRRAQLEGDMALYILPGKAGEEVRSRLAQWMHDANKQLLSGLLIDTVRDRISLHADEIS
ncbi:TIGR04255 family protein [Leptolyngbya sp. FACHB-541]|uniref:TIGR04255 family protein n=1 Tax=Leptolyngbya sp. FACHB-541 TaxID=2692810 RepID=UPI001686C1BA|nr:TIGR04255 family protein [Leptolyngbya sp. FACHB-541]MBD1995094.1 TIGR04255 family protein [Leptolyngbya sp. FACHB-541]